MRNSAKQFHALLDILHKQGVRALLYETFLSKHTSSLVKLIRYMLVATAAYVVDFGLLAILVSGFGLYYLFAATISFLFGTATNYLLSYKWVFPSSRHSRHKEIVGVLLISTMGLILNIILLALFTDLIGLFYIYSKLIATAIVFFWNFFARHVFSRPADTPEPSH